MTLKMIAISIITIDEKEQNPLPQNNRKKHNNFLSNGILCLPA
jgi:hypothetical protein